MGKVRILMAVLSVFCLLSIPVLDAAAAAGSIGNAIPITGTYAGGKFVGTFDISRFVVQDGRIFAIGVIKGTLTQTTGPFAQAAAVSQSGTTATNVMMPVAASGNCDILHLELGPLDLDLLGLLVHLDRVVLDISAQSGAGNLLGNLLCAITNLLNGPSLGQQLANLLNQLLSIL
jgi:hypothetical protein